MALPPNEPTTAEAVQQWIEKNSLTQDRFAHVAAKYDSHRAQHGCYDVYPYPNGALLGTLAAAHRAKRIVEVGGGLGYSALWFAYGAGTGSLRRIGREGPRSREHRARAFQSRRAKRAHRHLAGTGRNGPARPQGRIRSRLLRHRSRRVAGRLGTLYAALETGRVAHFGKSVSRPIRPGLAGFGKNRRIPRANLGRQALANEFFARRHGLEHQTLIALSQRKEEWPQRTQMAQNKKADTPARRKDAKVGEEIANVNDQFFLPNLAPLRLCGRHFRIRDINYPVEV